MSRIIKKAISIFIGLLMSVSIIPINNDEIESFLSMVAYAEETTHSDDSNLVFSGNVGTKLSWSIDKNSKTLTINNVGSMVSFSADPAPWIQAKEYIENAVISEGCTTVSNKAFYCCTSLKSISVPSTVTSIGNYAFYYCTSLNSISIPSTVTSIGEYAFYMCSSLTGNLKLSNCTIEYDAFYKSSITTIQLSNCRISSYAFHDCAVESVELVNCSINYGSCFFYSCNKLTNVTISNSIIPIYCFYNCPSLTELTFSYSNDNNYSVPSYAFYGCESLENVVLPAQISSINSFAFAGCPNLKDITISNKDCTISTDAISIYSTIHGYSYSTAEQFANEYGYNFVSIDGLCNESDHKYEEISRIESTCYSKGVVSLKCSICNNIVSSSLPYADHELTEWNCIVTPTCQTTGWKERNCKNCNYSESEEVSTISHSDENEDGICDKCFSSVSTKYLASGRNSDDVYWTLNSEGILRIFGSENMGSPEQYTNMESSTRYDYYTSTTKAKNDIEDDATKAAEESKKAAEEASKKAVSEASSKAAESSKADASTTDSASVVTTKQGQTLYCDETSSSVYKYSHSRYYDETTTHVTTQVGSNESSSSEYHHYNYSTTSRKVDSSTSYETHVNTSRDIAGDETTQATTATTVSASTSVYITYSSWLNYKELIKEVVVEEGIKTISGGAFVECVNLEKVSLPNSLEIISENAFRDCVKLSNITIPQNVQIIGHYVFYGCSNLLTMNFNAQNCLFFYETFNNTNVEYLKIGAHVNNLPVGHFYKTLKTLEFEEGRSDIPYSCCRYLTYLDYYRYTRGYNNVYSNNVTCEKLETVILPSTITSIGGSSFAYCSKLKNIVLPEGLQTIGNNAFYMCSALSEVVIPQSVSTIYYDAFANCTGLNKVTYNALDCQPHYEAFYGSKNIKELGIGPGVKCYPNIPSTEKVILSNGVIMIPTYAFTNWKKLKSVSMPDSLLYIGFKAFRGCESIENIKLPKNLRGIEDNAFLYCTSLKEITIPENVDGIGTGAFTGCSALIKVTFNAKNCYYGDYGYAHVYHYSRSVNNQGMFRLCDNIAEVSFGDKVEVIPAGLLRDKTQVSSITIPQSVKEIQKYAFYNTSIPSITIPQNVTKIGKSCFENCRNLKKVILSDSVITVEDCAFKNCTSVTELTLSNNLKSVGTSAFNGLSVKSLNIPESLESFGSSAFANLRELKEINFNAENAALNDPWYSDTFANAGANTDGISVVFGPECKKVPEWLFEVGSETAYPKIKNVTIGNNVETIGRYAFYHLGSLETVSFGNKVSEIGEYAFSCCTKLKDIRLPVSLSKICNNAFENCYSIDELVLPNNIKQIKNCAFDNISISTLTIPENIEYLDSSAFENCCQLKNVTYNAVSCNSSGLSNCTSVENVYIGKNVEYIDSYAFSGAKNIKRVYLPDVPINIDSLAFYGCNDASIVCKSGSYGNMYAVENGIRYILEDNSKGTAFIIKNGILNGYTGTAKNIVVPSDVTSIGVSAFNGSNVESVEIPYGVSKIYSNAFNDCSSLEKVIIPFTVTDIADNAFSNSNATIYCYAESYPYLYAKSHGISKELITVFLSTNEMSIVRGERSEISATPSVTLYSGIPVVWKTENSDIASVDNDGNVVAVNKGETTINAYSLFGNLLDSCKVIVTNPITKISIAGYKKEITEKYHTTITFKALVENSSGEDILWYDKDGKLLHVGETYTVKKAENSYTVCAKTIDYEGNEISTEIETVNIQNGFFDKIAAFFRMIFNKLTVYTQE